MSNANIEFVNLATANRGTYAVAVYPTASLGWAANYGALEVYNHPTRIDALASLRLALEISATPCAPSDFKAFERTLSYAERGARY